LSPEEAPTDDQSELEDEAQNESEESPQRETRRERRQRLGRELVVRKGVYAVADAIREPIVVVFKSPRIDAHGGDPGVIAELVGRFDRFMDDVFAENWLTEMSFGNSVTIELQPIIPEDAVAEIEQVVSWDGPDFEKEKEVVELIPDPAVGNLAAADVIGADPRVAQRRASVYGASALDSFRRFAVSLEKRSGDVRIDGAAIKPARLTSEQAAVAAKARPAPQVLATTTLTFAGRLTRTDSEAEHFRIELDMARVPDTWNRQRTHVEGSYTTEARRQVEAGGLWNQLVLATVKTRPVLKPGATRASYDDDSFRFISIERQP
jgi:hypothetical protein